MSTKPPGKPEENKPEVAKQPAVKQSNNIPKEGNGSKPQGIQAKPLEDPNLKDCGCVPRKVSPLIKFFRWSFLIAGILYGMQRHSRLSKSEKIVRAEEAEKKKIRDEFLAVEKKRISEEENKYLNEWLARGGADP